ncbi:MAG: hypothetical protein RL021_550 [Bacteroidota bacterium]|jgi:hypothetical protein
MKRAILLLTSAITLFTPFFASGQLLLLLSDDFESYAPYQVCNAYTTDIQVYPTHGTNSSQGLRAFMNSFDSKDSLLTGWIKPLNLPDNRIEFDFRIMEASALYPFIPATLTAGDRFSVLYTTDNQNYVTAGHWNAANFTPVTNFTHANLTIPSCDSARFMLLVTRTNNPNDYFVDIDNLLIGNFSAGISPLPPPDVIAASPNPFKDVLVIRTTQAEGFAYSLFDLEGRLLRSGNTAASEGELYAADLPEGNYLLKVRSGDKEKVFSLVKSR